MPLAVLVGACSWLAACDGDRAQPRNAQNDAAASAPAAGEWQLVFSELPGALISVWGTGSNDVWAAGSLVGDGSGPLVLHYDGSEWQRLITGAGSDVWWVHGIDGGPVLFGGSDGMILTYEGNRFQRMDTPSGEGTVFGIWGAAPDDVWAVGGDLMGSGGAFVWRFDGEEWKSVSLPPGTGAGPLFKVWGTGAKDVWIVGARGDTIHYDGNGFRHQPAGVADPLFTVHSRRGSAEALHVAVGGYDLGVLMEHDGSGWERAEVPESTRQLFGVWLSTAGSYAVGADARVLSRQANGWASEPLDLETTKPLHAVWVDPSGGVWAVGGDVLVPPLGQGVLVHRGAEVPTTYETIEPPGGAGGAGGVSTDASVSSGGSGGAGGAGGNQADASPADAGARVDARADAGPGDAEPEASSLPDGAVSRAETPGQVACGSASCDLSVNRCCMDRMTQVGTCVPQGESCPVGAYPLACDDGADCSPNPCCLLRAIQGGAIAGADCATSCDNEQLCASSGECGAGFCAEGEDLPPRYAACQ